jgi:hypothetical protein
MSPNISTATGKPALDFLDWLELPPFHGCRLAVTATRALERYSDLLDHRQSRADLRVTEIGDITDEFLDLVVVNPEAPAGFEFTGLSFAEFLAALHRANVPLEQLSHYRQVLTHPALERLREAARARIRVMRKDTWFRQIGLRLPSHHKDAPRTTFPLALAPLMSAADSAWKPPQRSRLTVEILHTVAALQTPRIPLRGKRFPREVWGSSWVNWWGCRLLPRTTPNISDFSYNEVQLALPSLETSYFSAHYRVRNLFAHFRFTTWSTPTGARVMLVDEVQSDWLRDWRWQRLGRDLPAIRVVGRQNTEAHALPAIPACPYQEDWLKVTTEMIIRHAQNLDCHVLAWTPGCIQQALNAKLPLPTAERLYDRRLPRTIKQALLAQGSRALEFPVEYPCWSTDFYTRWDSRHGWRVFKREGDQPVSSGYKIWDEANEHLEKLAKPMWVPLSGYLLF